MVKIREDDKGVINIKNKHFTSTKREGGEL